MDRPRRPRIALSTRGWMFLAVVLPVALVFAANAQFVWNIFVDRPHLHDIGWYSAIVWHNGLSPQNPPAAHYLRAYYDVHVSPLVSIGSLVSYLVPIGRVRWYCVFEGAIYAPLGAMVGVLVGREGRRLDVRDAAVVGLASVLFAFNGQVISCMSFPHYEIFVAVGCCTMLAALATGRPRLAWFGMVLAAATREDGGFHAAFLLIAVLASDRLGRSFRVSRRIVLMMAFVAFALSVAALLTQKLFFVPANLFRQEYLGEPAYAHLGATMLVGRVRNLFTQASFIALPLVGTVAIAVARRDGRYLLGWAATLPWLVVNLLAFQDLKSWFSSYTGFPFVGAIFWVGAYARACENTPVRRLWLRPLVLVSTLSIVGASFSQDVDLGAVVARAFVPTSTPTKELETFAAALERDPATYGQIYVDPGVASWATSSMTPREMRFTPEAIESFDDTVGATFFADGAWRPGLKALLERSPFRTCGRLPDTPVYFCGRDGHELPPEFVPASSPTSP